MPEASTSSRKRPLTWEEVPLPPLGGFTNELLRPEFKKQQLIDQLAKKEEVLRRRITMNERAENDVDYQDLIIERCRRDMVFFIDHFIWVHEPRLQEDRALILYEFQVTKIVKPYITLRDTKPPARVTQMTCKSRDMGVTWVKLGCRVHSYLFQKGWTCLLGGVNQKMVDDGGLLATHQSLMGKVRFMLRNLPKWFSDRMMGPIWERDEFNKRLALINPMNPSNFWHGAQVGEMFGRSGRYFECMVDEFAYAENIKNAEKAVKQTTTRFDGNSTPDGRNNLFAQLMFSDELRVVRIFIWWPEHPEKDISWFNEQRADMDEADIASELNLSFDESMGGRVLPEVHFSTHFIEGYPPTADGFDGTLYNPTLPVQITIDFGASAPMAAIWTQWDEQNLVATIIDFVQVQGVSVDWIVPFITGVMRPLTWRNEPWPHSYNQIEMEMIERHRRWKAPDDVYGDWQGRTANLVSGAYSAFDELGKYSISLTPIKILDDFECITAARRMMRLCRIDKRLLEQRNGDSKWCPTFGEVLTQWAFKKPQEGQTQKSLVPVHNVYCHGGDCLKMWATTINLPDEAVLQQAVEAGRVIAKRGSDIVRGRWRR